MQAGDAEVPAGILGGMQTPGKGAPVPDVLSTSGFSPPQSGTESFAAVGLGVGSGWRRGEVRIGPSGAEREPGTDKPPPSLCRHPRTLDPPFNLSGLGEKNVFSGLVG